MEVGGGSTFGTDASVEFWDKSKRIGAVIIEHKGKTGYSPETSLPVSPDGFSIKLSDSLTLKFTPTPTTAIIGLTYSKKIPSKYGFSQFNETTFGIGVDKTNFRKNTEIVKQFFIQSSKSVKDAAKKVGPYIAIFTAPFLGYN